MKVTFVTGAIVALTCLATVAIADHHKGSQWFDLENCAMCKHMASHADMMAEMKWETHVIDNGMLSVAMIPEKHQATMKEVNAKMKAVGDELQAGKELHLCGFCNSYGGLMESGAKEQQVETSFGMIAMLTSDDPEVVKKIHGHAKRTIAEYDAMLKAQSQGKAKE